MDLSISIVSWNTRDLLDRCLESIYKSASAIDFEVTVVDNTSSDGSVDMVRQKYPDVRVISNSENVGFARANNQAYAMSSGKYFLLLNPDTLVLGDALNRLIDFAENHAMAGAVGPLVRNEDGSLQYTWAKFPTMLSEVIGYHDRRVIGMARPPSDVDEARSLAPFCVDWVGGCCLLIKREVVEQIGLMDESLFMYCEETDWCLRLHKAGWQVWVEPSAEIMHYGGRSSAQISQKCEQTLRRSKTSYFRKHNGPVQACVLAGLLASKSWISHKMRKSVR